MIILIILLFIIAIILIPFVAFKKAFIYEKKYNKLN